MTSFDLPAFGFLPTFLILSAIMVVRYFVLAGSMHLLRGRLGTPIEPGAVDGAMVRRDIKWSVLSSLVFALAGTVLIFLWRAGLTKIHTGPVTALSLLSLAAYLLIHDTYFYWTHVLMHRYAFSIHRAHHQSRRPTAWTSFSFHPAEALIQALILPVLVVLVPIHWLLLLLFLLLMSVLGLLNHLGYELYPAFLERRFGLISATHHQAHHRNITVNYGLYFTWWDHLMQTESGGRFGKK